MEDKRLNILEAALKVISENKIAGTRMHLIAKEAQVNKSMLHYYFDTKNDLLKSLLEHIGERFVERRKELKNLENKRFADNLKAYFAQKKNSILNEKEIEYAQMDYWVLGTGDKEIQPYMSEFYHSWREAIAQSLAEAVKKEEIKDEDLDMLPLIIISTMMGASLQYLIDEESFDLDRYFHVVEKMILKSIHR